MCFGTMLSFHLFKLDCEFNSPLVTGWWCPMYHHLGVSGSPLVTGWWCPIYHHLGVSGSPLVTGWWCPIYRHLDVSGSPLVTGWWCPIYRHLDVSGSPLVTGWWCHPLAILRPVLTDIHLKLIETCFNCLFSLDLCKWPSPCFWCSTMF